MEDRPLASSCFLTPETPGDRKIPNETVPLEWSPSSTFLTPPSSQERGSSHDFLSAEIIDLPKLDYGIENDHRSQKRSPLLPEDRIIGIPKKLNELDIISELLARNCGRICQSICGYLEGNDLCRFVFLFSSVKIFSKDFGVAEFVSNLNIFI